jgi:peptidoglycan/xylan/chitin deacetylase (PgdA/CDA1 family)
MRRTERYHKKNHTVLGLVIGLVIILLAIGGLVLTQVFKSEPTASGKPAETTSSMESSGESPTPETSLISGSNDNQIPILMYHYVSGDPADRTDSNWMSTETFESQLQALKDNGYTTLTAEQAEHMLTTKERPSDKVVWLTFDDGSLTMARDVSPLLQKYGMHATAFIVTGFVDANQGGILSWQQIKDMQNSGAWDFGSHTVSHADLGSGDAASIRAQLEQSRDRLNQELGIDTNIICYPAGGYNDQTLQIATELGYKFGLQDPGRNGAIAQPASAENGLLTLPRYRMMGSTTADQMLDMLQAATAHNEANH